MADVPSTGAVFQSALLTITERAPMTEDQPTVFVIDDDASVREAIKSLVRSVGLRAEAFAIDTRLPAQKALGWAQLPCARCQTAWAKRA